MRSLSELSMPIHGARVNAMPPGLVDGRSLRDGYARGIALQYGNALDLLRRDGVFARAWSAAEGRTVVTLHALANLFLLARFYLLALPEGDIAEFGARRGGSAMFLAAAAPTRRVYAFDTYTGIPSSDARRDVHRVGDFGAGDGTDLAEIRARAAQLGLDNIEFVEGEFGDTAGALDGRRLALAHVDCDAYESVRTAYGIARERCLPGAYVVFDDGLMPSCLGAFQAIEELAIRRDGLHAEQTFPHLVYRMGGGV